MLTSLRLQSQSSVYFSLQHNDLTSIWLGPNMYTPYSTSKTCFSKLHFIHFHYTASLTTHWRYCLSNRLIFDLKLARFVQHSTALTHASEIFVFARSSAVLAAPRQQTLIWSQFTGRFFLKTNHNKSNSASPSGADNTKEMS